MMMVREKEKEMWNVSGKLTVFAREERRSENSFRIQCGLPANIRIYRGEKMGLWNFKSTAKISLYEMKHKNILKGIKCDIACNAHMYASLCVWASALGKYDTRLPLVVQYYKLREEKKSDICSNPCKQITQCNWIIYTNKLIKY